MEAAMAAMQLNALLRKAVSTAKGVRIRMDAQQFEMTVVSGILWFKVCVLRPTQRAAARAADTCRCCERHTYASVHRHCKPLRDRVV